jgi:uncharacterized membrane protein YsdA (DUF1294 family)
VTYIKIGVRGLKEMDSKLISFLVGYFFTVNIASIIYIWLNVKTNLIKLKEKNKDLISVIFSIIGGFVGILLGSEMLQYKQDKKLYKRWIPLIIFVEFMIIVFIVYNKLNI